MINEIKTASKVFLASFVLVFLASWFGRLIIPYFGNFPYKEILVCTHDFEYCDEATYKIPNLLQSRGNFDGVNYIRIAKKGYEDYLQAFFPLYPLLIFILRPISGNLFNAGLFISLTSFLLGLIFLIKFIKSLQKDNKSIKTTYTLLSLLVFPTAFFFQMLYTESLFLVFLSLYLLFFYKRKYILAGLSGVFLALTRLIGLAVIIFPLVEMLVSRRYDRKVWLSLIGPTFGFGLYSGYLWWTRGDPLFFLTVQPNFGAHREAGVFKIFEIFSISVPVPLILIAIKRYISILSTAVFNFQYFIALFEFITFLFFITLLAWDLKMLFEKRTMTFSFYLALNLFSWANLLIGPSTGTLSSLPRYVLFSLSVFLLIARWGVKSRLVYFIVAFILQVILIGFFVQGYFVS